MKETRMLSEIYEPLGEEIVFEFIREDRTAKGILIPEQSQKQERICEVVAVGKECKYVKVGDFILISPTSRPKVIDLISNNHIQIWEKDVLGIVNKDFKMQEQERFKKIRNNGIAEDVQIIDIKRPNKTNILQK